MLRVQKNSKFKKAQESNMTLKYRHRAAYIFCLDENPQFALSTHERVMNQTTSENS